MTKIVIAPRFEPGEEALGLLRGVARVTVLEDDSEAVLLDELRDAAALLIGIEPRVTRRLMESAPGLKHIARQGVGVDIVDVQAATDRGIFVTNVPDVTSDSVAEFAMTLLLGLAKNIIRCNSAVREGRWEERTGLIRTNIELKGKTHGVIGLGRIGSRVAVRCQAFGMKVLYTRRNRDLAFEKATGVEYAPIETLIRESDSISLHLPLTKETTNLIDTPQFMSMKKTVLLINHSRGAVVNEKALVQALHEGRIGGYGTDVYGQEPPDSTGELFRFKNVVVSPHLGGGTREARARANMMVAHDVVRVIRGGIPENLVNREVLNPCFQMEARSAGLQRASGTAQRPPHFLSGK
ncbi:MAG: D-glycerate dehydrogenase [Deltaproteobacteria bacterium]|nr:D-glycerate dehydrogenase [Deltaproteobacteria bacterium]